MDSEWFLMVKVPIAIKSCTASHGKNRGGRSRRKSRDLNSERALENTKRWIELILVVDISVVKTCCIGGCFCRIKLQFQGGQNFITQIEWWLFAFIASEGQVHWSPNFANNISRGSRLYFQDMRINNGVVVKFNFWGSHFEWRHFVDFLNEYKFNRPQTFFVGCSNILYCSCKVWLMFDK
jgi:hypothetical protein